MNSLQHDVLKLHAASVGITSELQDEELIIKDEDEIIMPTTLRRVLHQVVIVNIVKPFIYIY